MSFNEEARGKKSMLGEIRIGESAAGVSEGYG